MEKYPERSISLVSDDMFGESLLSKMTSMLWDEESIPDVQLSEVISFEILDPPSASKAEESNKALSEKAKKITNVSLNQIIEHTPKPSFIREIYCVDSLSFEEARVIGRFQEYLLTEGLSLPEWVFHGEVLALKCLHSCERKFAKTYKRLSLLIAHQEKVKALKIIDHIDFLNSGSIYTVGRDLELRPIIIIDLLKLVKSQTPASQIINACYYFFDYIKYNLLVPSKVETWTIIIDCRGINTSAFQKNNVKTIIKNMGQLYPCRLHTMFIIDPPSLLKFLWKLSLIFVKKSTQQKINILPEDFHMHLQSQIDRTQLEAKFGGKVKDKLRYFFPPSSRI